MKIVALVPGLTDGKGKGLPVGEEVDVDDETANALRMDGKASLPYDPKAEQEGNYRARTGRGDVEGQPTVGDTAVNKEDPKRKT